MTSILKLIPWTASLFIAAIFVDSLRFKFTGHETPKHIFTTLRDWSGIDLFYPAGPWVIGLGELAASLLLLVIPLALLAMGKIRELWLSQIGGALIALAIMSGAIVFHLFTPLGIATPTEWANGDPTAHSSALFTAAVISWFCALLILLWRRRQVKADQ